MKKGKPASNLLLFPSSVSVQSCERFETPCFSAVIAAMTVGKDVSMLLADVTKNGQTENLELKKLVYLYLINYAKSQPDLAILAVNTFVKARGLSAREPVRIIRSPLRAESYLPLPTSSQDSQDPNPLIRALAVRTMGCIRVDKITEYLCDPLQKTLKVWAGAALPSQSIFVASLCSRLAWPRATDLRVPVLPNANTVHSASAIMGSCC